MRCLSKDLVRLAKTAVKEERRRGRRRYFSETLFYIISPFNYWLSIIWAPWRPTAARRVPVAGQTSDVTLSKQALWNEGRAADARIPARGPGTPIWACEAGTRAWANSPRALATRLAQKTCSIPRLFWGEPRATGCFRPR